MNDFDEFPHIVWWEIEKYFIDKMMMRCTYLESDERTYSDDFITIIISIKFPENKMRLNIGGNSIFKKFSKSFIIVNYTDIISTIFKVVKSEGNSILNDWVDLKKSDIRNTKINQLLK
jgi:hypothetical protein